jgi:hypothetical protein
MSPRDKTKVERLVAYVGPKLRRRAERYAERHAISISMLIAWALTAYLDEKGVKS